MTWHTDNNFTVTIAGGSIAGLCHAMALRKIGATVKIHERVPEPMMARGAGIVIQGELIRVLHENDAPSLPFTSCRGRRYVEPGGGDGVYRKREMGSEHRRRFLFCEDRATSASPRNTCPICASQFYWGMADAEPFLDLVG